MHTRENIQKNLTKIKQILDHPFTQDALLLQAFIHRSFVNENRHLVEEHNERLEFLGDSVLGLCVAKMLYERYPEHPEGMLSQLRSRLVDVDACVLYMETLCLQEYILVGKGEEKTLGKRKSSIVADAFEAIVAAIFLDGGFAAAQRFLQQHFSSKMDELLEGPYTNYKALLQDYAQKKHQKPPCYKMHREEGPDHEKTFFVAVYIEDAKWAEGEGSSKKEAEQNAAKIALEELKKEGLL